MKKLICLILSTIMLLSVFPLSACGDEETNAAMTRVTVDINPSIELMVDKDNKVVSATALNDDGSVLLVGEAVVGKTPEEATELIISLATDTGYLVKGNVEATENTVKISVSGDGKYAEKLYNKLSDKAQANLERLDIEGKVEKAEALKTEALRSLALKTSIYTEEELEKMTDEQLYAVIAEGRVETALMLTEEMRKAYFEAKSHEISFAESEATAKVIEGMGVAYRLVYGAYSAALDVYSGAIESLNTLRYETLVSPESAYQKSLTALRNAKSDLLKARSYRASLEVNGEEYASASITLQASEQAYNNALTAYENLGAQLNASLEATINALKKGEQALRSIEESFDEQIEETLKQKATELETTLNQKKAEFFAKFEEAHGDDLDKVEAELLSYKQALKDKIAAKAE